MIPDDRLPRCGGPYRASQSHLGARAAVRRGREGSYGAGHGRRAISHLGLDRDRRLAWGIDQPANVLDLDAVRIQVGLWANVDAVASRVDVRDVGLVAESEAEAASLTDSEMLHAVVRSDARAAAVHDRAGADGAAAWHFRIVDKTVSVGRGAIEEADMNVSADYKSVLPMVRLVYTPEMVAQMQRGRPQAPAESSGGQVTPPSWLVELHNRLAVVTE